MKTKVSEDSGNDDGLAAHMAWMDEVATSVSFYKSGIAMYGASLHATR